MVLGMAVGAFAQMGEPVKVHISRSLGVGQNWLPVGDYSIRAFETGSVMTLLAIESGEGVTVLAPARRSATPRNSVFGKSAFEVQGEGNRVYLKKVSMAGRSYMYEIIPGVEAPRAPAAGTESCMQDVEN